MAWPWIADALKTFPWRKAAIAAAPTVIDLTKKVWNGAAKPRGAAKSEDTVPTAAGEEQPARLAAMEERLRRLEGGATEVENELRALRSKLTPLEDRSLQLTQSVQVLESRVRILIMVALAACIGIIGLIIWVAIHK
jgi:predicted nuclease with TOPRIM domain